MQKIKKVYILGNHIQALGISRMAAKKGLEVTLYNGYGASVTRYSNTCKHFVLFRDEEHLIQMLLEKPVGVKDTMLIATNDWLIGLMARHYDALGERYFLTIPRPDVVLLCFNKRHTYRSAMELGIPIPETHFPDTLEEVKELGKRVRFPVIIKPAVMYTFHKATGKKVFFCSNEEELVQSYQEILNIIPPEEVIIQQFLTGGAKSLYSFGSFFAGGTAWGGFVANRIRQKPMDFGISTCYARSVDNPKLEQMGIDFLKAIDYFGPSEVEFMLDPETGVYRLIEINPRFWKWHSMTNKLNIDLLSMMVDYLEGKELKPVLSRRADVGWVERVTDTYVVLGELLKGRLSFSEYWKTMQLPKESAVWSLRDPLPAILYVIMTPYLFFKRN